MRKKTFESTSKLILAQEMATGLMGLHGLSGWMFAFNSNLRRAGVCRHPFVRKNVSRPGTIELSAHFVNLNDEAEVRDTILHEIAHALAGKGHGHNAVWRKKCLEVGARPERCYGEHVEMPKGKWSASCPSCSKVFHRHRRPKAHRVIWCAKCGRENGLLKWMPVGA